MIPQVPEIYNVGVETESGRGDFIGFQYGGETSASLGVIRISDGSRYNEDLLPSMNDSVAQVDGVNQTYYFGNTYQDKQIDLEVAFDHLTETQFRHLNWVFGRKELQKLIFDETPYKYYMVKPNAAPQFKYICFNEPKQDGPGEERIYKGEGTISLVAYYPFAKSVHKYLDEFFVEVQPTSESTKDWKKIEGIWTKVEKGQGDFYQSNINDYLDNIEEWKDSSNLLDNLQDHPQGEIDYDTLSGKIDNHYYIKTYNAGDMTSDLRIIITPPVEETTIPEFTISTNTIQNIKVKNFELIGDDSKLIIDSKLHVLRGATAAGTDISHNTYNQYIEECNSFPKLLLKEDQGQPVRETTLNFTGDLTGYTVNVEYNHLYY